MLCIPSALCCHVVSRTLDLCTISVAECPPSLQRMYNICNIYVVFVFFLIELPVKGTVCFQSVSMCSFFFFSIFFFKPIDDGAFFALPYI